MADLTNNAQPAPQTTQTNVQPAAPVKNAQPVPTTPATPAAAAAVVKPGAPRSEQWRSKLGDLEKLQQTQGRVKELEPKAQRLDALLEKLKSDPLAALAELGTDWDTLARAKVKAAAGPAPAAAAASPEAKALEAKVSEVEKRIAAAETASQTAVQQQEQARWNAYVQSVDAGVKADVENFPLINALGASKLVVDEITNHFGKTQKVITPAEAAKAVEERIGAELDELKKSNPKAAARLGSIFGGAAVAVVDEAPKRAPSGVRGRPTPAKTLGGGVSPAAAAPGEVAAKPAAAAAAKRPPSGVNHVANGFAEWRRQKHGGTTT